MSKIVKEMVVEELKKQLGSCTDMLVINSSRLDAVTDNRFRLALREKEIRVLTVKNSLAKTALNSVGIRALDPILEGPSTLVWGGEDIVALSKEIAKWAKEITELDIRGGALEGKTLTAADVQTLSKSPGREELLGQIVFLALSPGARLVGALLGPGGMVCGQVATVAENEE